MDPLLHAWGKEAINVVDMNRRIVAHWHAKWWFKDSVSGLDWNWRIVYSKYGIDFIDYILKYDILAETLDDIFTNCDDGVTAKTLIQHCF